MCKEDLMGKFSYSSFLTSFLTPSFFSNPVKEEPFDVPVNMEEEVEEDIKEEMEVESDLTDLDEILDVRVEGIEIKLEF
jgi:hypothetical protein